MHTRFLIAFAVITGAACTGHTDDTADDDVEVAEQASTGTESSTDLVYVSALFSTDVDTTIAAIEADVDVPACVSFDTDGLTFLEVAFDECLLAAGNLLVDGAVRADVSVSGAAAVFAVTAADLRVGPAVVTGAWEVRDPFAPGAPSTWTGQTDIAGDGGRSVAMTSTASWTVDGTCVTASFDGSIERLAGETSLQVADLSRCAGQCPSAGTVSVTYAVGATLTWTYHGDGTATVTGSGGRTFDILLPCNF